MNNIYYAQYNNRWSDPDKLLFIEVAKHHDDSLNTVLQTFRLTLIRE